jgi:uncharacterized protein YjbI with pentapeptide repeats
MTVQPVSSSNRWAQIMILWRDNRWLYVVAGMLLGLLMTPAVEQVAGDLNGLIGNLVPEAIGIIFTVLILDRLNENRARESYKESLRRQAGSVVNDVAVDAIEQLRKEGWTEGEQSVLQGLNLIGANLANARLHKSNLQKADLEGANLKAASLSHSNLTSANLIAARLEEAELYEANLSGADLRVASLNGSNFGRANLQNANLHLTQLEKTFFHQANLKDAKFSFNEDNNRALHGHALLKDADFEKANLEGVSFAECEIQGCNFMNANLRGANFEDTTFDKKTILPDAEIAKDEDYNDILDEDGHPIYTKYWTLDTDMCRYTDPDHPDFWYPDYFNRYSWSWNSFTRPLWVPESMIINNDTYEGGYIDESGLVQSR